MPTGSNIFVTIRAYPLLVTINDFVSNPAWWEVGWISWTPFGFLCPTWHPWEVDIIKAISSSQKASLPQQYLLDRSEFTARRLRRSKIKNADKVKIFFDGHAWGSIRALPQI